ncbi:glycoside hydrolase family 18 [Dysgonomonas sp. PF1-23]|nr:glycoside hydrolase family 18 [Dysgonomonas sp. PF1-23]MDH6396429.1 hypothetical protein [Dysgonomonas sp. PF1-23]
MNKILIFLLSLIAGGLLLTSCSDWTEDESVDIKQPEKPAYGKYLENLREYKKTDHVLVYAWVDNSEKKPYSRAHHITDLPDSVDIIGLMHPDELVNWELEDISKVRNDKGTRVIYTIDFEAIKAAYNAKLELATEEEPIALEFLDFLTDSLEYSLSLVNKYNYDGICIGYAGKSRLHMRPNELKQYIENETAFINIMRDWKRRNPGKMTIYEGKPQNLIDTSLLDDCLSILISGKTATAKDELTYTLFLANIDNIAKDRFGMVVMAIDLNDPNKSTGYFSNGTVTMEGLADWASVAHDGIKVKAVGVYNASTDYHTTVKDYYYLRKIISSVNPSIK